MSKISCDIIQDMLPLYYDEVCSADSRKMIEEHLQECEKCSNIFQKLKTVWSPGLSHQSGLQLETVWKRPDG